MARCIGRRLGAVETLPPWLPKREGGLLGSGVPRRRPDLAGGTRLGWAQTTVQRHGRPTGLVAVERAVELTTYVSAADDLTLHAPRVLGYASAKRIAAHFHLDADEVEDRLLEFAGKGWVAHSRFADTSGWHLTDTGRSEDERRLSVELDLAGGRDIVSLAHQAFLPLNRTFGQACTNWQIRPAARDPMVFNDHTDWGWDERVFRSLDALGRQLATVTDPVTRVLQRFQGYDTRYAAALARVNAGQPRWIDAPELDSCHTVWIQLHEDLLSTLHLPRGSDS